MRVSDGRRGLAAWTRGPAGPSRRRLLAGLLAAAAGAPGKPGRGRAAGRWRCCSAVARAGGVVDRRHVCVKATEACPEPPAGFRLNCEAVVATCGRCGKTVCPARD
jgi:hypothetical protein